MSDASPAAFKPTTTLNGVVVPLWETMVSHGVLVLADTLLSGAPLLPTATV